MHVWFDYFIILCSKFLITSILVTYTGGSGRHRRSKDAEGGKDCPVILDENIEIEVIRPGKDGNGDSSSNGRGAVVKVSCASGYELNLPKRKVPSIFN